MYSSEKGIALSSQLVPVICLLSCLLALCAVTLKQEDILSSGGSSHLSSQPCQRILCLLQCPLKKFSSFAVNAAVPELLHHGGLVLFRNGITSICSLRHCVDYYNTAPKTTRIENDL